MTIYYKDGFYFDDIHQQIPSGAVQISEDLYRSLLEGQSQGKQIIADKNGVPQLIEPPPSDLHELQNGEWVISKANRTALFQQQQQRLVQKVANKTDLLKSQLLVGYPQAEIDSFYRQEREARGWLADNSYPTPMLAAIAQNRGVPLEILAQKVIEKADQVAQLVGVIIGQRQHFEDVILSAKTEENLTAVEQEIEQWTVSI